MLTLIYSTQNPQFFALRAFHTFHYEKPSGATRSPQLVLRAFHNLRLISSATLSEVCGYRNHPRWVSGGNSKIGLLGFPLTQTYSIPTAQV